MPTHETQWQTSSRILKNREMHCESLTMPAHQKSIKKNADLDEIRAQMIRKISYSKYLKHEYQISFKTGMRYDGKGINIRGAFVSFQLLK